MKKILLILLLFLVACDKKPADAPLPTREYNLAVAQYNVENLGKVGGATVIDLVSFPGESRDAFFIRAGYEMLIFSNSTNFESCGRFAISKRQGDPRLAIRIWTNFSHKGCLLTNFAPDGFVAVGEYMHSHPVSSPVVFNETDHLLMKNVPVGARVTLIIDDFSKEDYAAGPGYLVANRRLKYQNGIGRVRQVATY